MYTTQLGVALCSKWSICRSMQLQHNMHITCIHMLAISGTYLVEIKSFITGLLNCKKSSWSCKNKMQKWFRVHQFWNWLSILSNSIWSIIFCNKTKIKLFLKKHESPLTYLLSKWNANLVIVVSLQINI